ncbi:MAG TPA: hypothetical protein VJ787_10485 [Thermoleophilia bacterium]|nr:hypothetical protein [Thermoleophilia bacterium]
MSADGGVVETLGWVILVLGCGGGLALMAIGYVLLFVQGRRRRGAALLWNGFALAFAALIVGILVMPTG